jgi:hypothetical protein
MSAYDLDSVKEVEEHLDLIPSLSDLSRWGLREREHLAGSKLLQAAATTQEHNVNNHK